MNPRLTKRDLGLIKGAINRIFPRSELYKQAIDKLQTLHNHVDPKRKRVKTWKLCPICNKPDAKSNFQVDHVDPRVPVDKTFAEMTLDEYVDRTWCDINNLTPKCISCHTLKTKAEKVERKLRRLKNEPREPKRPKKTVTQRSKRTSA